VVKGTSKLFVKHCRLERCKKRFETNREWQHFCCNEHRIEFWREEKKSTRAIIRHYSDLEQRIAKLEKTT